jgi:hypothetical protein
MSLPLPCIVCGKPLEDASGTSHVMPRDDDQWCNQPNDGLAFETRGHYGSTFFDPCREGVHCEITVCDSCLRKYPNRIAFTEEPPRGYRSRITEEEVG